MHNDLFTIGSVTIRSYGVMMAAGILFAMLVSLKRCKALSLNDDIGFNAIFIGIICGFVGAKLLYVVTELPAYIKNPGLLWESLSSGFVLYGGIVGGVGGACLYLRKKKVSVLQYLDVAIPSIPAAQGLGRIGCFLAGCCYGLETDGPFGVVFPISSAAPSGIPLIPTQLISSALDFALSAALFLVARKKPPHGFLAALYAAAYSAGRFGIEFLRNDPRGSVWVFSTSQFISLAVLPVAVFFMVRFAPQKKGRQES